MFKYVPRDMPENAPLVVSLHGCTQGAAVYSANGWMDLADNLKFYLLFPQQTFSNNPLRCFNWFEAGDIGRGRGEAASIKSMIDRMRADHSIDETRIFIEGLSAGGYMTAVMLAAYPDIFSGGAVNAGGPSYCATSGVDPRTCMGGTLSRSPEAWGDLVRSMGFAGYAGPWPRVSIWHGNRDGTVDVRNQEHLMAQWTDVHGIDRTPELSESVGENARRVYENGEGTHLVETWTIEGMGHGTPVDPGFAEAFGCGGAGAFILDRDICAVYHIGRFWGLFAESPPLQSPRVTLAAPEDGAFVEGMVSVLATAEDDTGVARVEFAIDGEKRFTDGAEPWGFDWDTSLEENGRRVLSATAFDAAGNKGADSVSVSVSGGVSETTPPVVTVDPEGGSFRGEVVVTLAADEPATIYYAVDGVSPTTDSAIYEAPLKFTETTTLSFFAEDQSENKNRSAVQSAVYELISHDEHVSARSWEHLNARRLTTGQFISAGSLHGHIEPFSMYRFGNCWTDDARGTGKLGDCIGKGCKSYRGSIGDHILAGRVYGTGFFFFKRYYAVGTDIRLTGNITTELELHQKPGEPDRFYPGGCGE